MVDSRNIAARRRTFNRGSVTNEGIEPDADEIGVAGEIALYRFLGVEKEPQSRKRTPGYQLVIGDTRIKVATSETPGHLLVPEGKVRADLYVLARYRRASNDAELVGFADAATVRAAPVRYPSKGTYGIRAHAIPSNNLQPAGALFVLLGLERRDAVAPAEQLGLGLDVRRSWLDG